MFESTDSNDLLKQVIATQRFAVLATQENEQPYMNLIAFAASNDLAYILFATDRNTHKYRNILKNEKVALLIDSRRNDTSDLTDALAITALGSAGEITQNRGDKLIIKYLNTHASLSEFISSSETAIIRISVKEYILARFDKVERIQIDKIP